MKNKVFLASAVYSHEFSALTGAPSHVNQLNFIGVAPTKKAFAEHLVGTCGMSERVAAQVARGSQVNDSFRMWVGLVEAGILSATDHGVYVSPLAGNDVYRVVGPHQVEHVATAVGQNWAAKEWVRV